MKNINGDDMNSNGYVNNSPRVDDVLNGNHTKNGNGHVHHTNGVETLVTLNSSVGYDEIKKAENVE